MLQFFKLSVAGFAATGIAYGPARMGFGLFLNEFRSTFSLSTTMAGIISGLGFAGFFIGLIMAYAATAKRGPRLPVLIGLFAATSGMGIVAMAPNVPVMAFGVILAMTSAGFAWSPYNNAVHQEVRDEMRSRSLSIISTGTSLGVAIAGVVALALIYAGVSWRIAWAIFAGAGALAFAGNWFAMEDVAGNPGGRKRSGWKTLWDKSAWLLYAVALSFGVTTTIFISFATDRVAQAGGLSGLPDGAAPAIMFITYGFVGLIALATASIKEHMGLANLIRLLLVISATSQGLIAFAPTSWAGVLVASGLQGVFVMMMSAVLAFWSERLFADLPSLSFTATLLAVAAGSVIGPAAAGFVSSAFSPNAMFLGAAAMSAITAAGVLPQWVIERAPDCKASATR